MRISLHVVVFDLEFVCIVLCSSEQRLVHPDYLLYIGDYTSHLYKVYNSHYRDPYKPTSIMECNKGFDHCSGG